ncbi:exodeoxyribonuclease V alpha subunit [Afipia massiliensis]|uniref:Exodeoxyribonuclease V alpha subunit n=1 Tax=Afipia massiliensis TaxID=211460 RepID=A0A840MWD1_9BRAD|nr:AAA family ATPase [Afipia massiliensis]MBB5051022.1 exodeoxyribonuclease V alpha subunit [Afipia massiliensis]
MILIGRDEAGALRRAVTPAKISARDPAVGESWRLTGTERVHSEYGLQLYADIALPLIPKGRALIRYLATDKRFVGVGWSTAEKLWSALGDDIYAHVQARQLAPIAAVVGPEKAAAIVDGFGLLADEVEVFRWLDRYGVSPRVAGATASLWGLQAIERIKADPYALTLLEPWAEVDARALRLGLPLDDERRLCSVVEEALAVRFRQGHMAAPSSSILPLVKHLATPWSGDPGQALAIAIQAGRIIAIGNDLLQSRACWFMEHELERFFRERLTRDVEPIDPAAIDDAISKVEAEVGYQLTKLQREAVFMATSSAVSVITGGAGTGKTTVVRAVLRASEARRAVLPTAEQSSFEYPQVALAGRAVRRIAEATGKEATTIARFLHQIESGGRRLQRGLMIFDEASMLDTPSVYRILSQIPVEVDLVFIGDPAQLPPIGPGILFRSMVAADAIPRVALDVIHRQADQTGIPCAGGMIRAGAVPSFLPFNETAPLAPGVFLVPARQDDDIASKTLQVFRAMCGPAPDADQAERLHALDVQILTQTKNGPAGAKALNQCIEAEYMARQARIRDWGLSTGSKILWLKNDYRKAPLRDRDGNVVLNPLTNEPTYSGFMNGAIGTIRHPHQDGAWVAFDDGTADAILAADLEKLTHGWAISVHKAQGSAFRRVILPIARSRLLDRTMIYTAATRAVETVVLIGDPDVISNAIHTAPKTTNRASGLQLEDMLDEQQIGSSVRFTEALSE